ncbi:RloB domain-containing protein [Sphingomonas aerolata]|uniref:RloB domain-containing protein n=2 Tax=Sphingomonas aerolata TaxID=185951 RepID=UPI003364F5D6
MSGRRRAVRPQRTRFFIGCEGESEQGYVALLQRMADAGGLHVHLDAIVLQPGGGDPCAIVEQALKRMKAREKQAGDPYAFRFVLLDADKRGQQPQRDARAVTLAADILHLIWQDPCYEAVLLRHLQGCAQLRPPLTPDALVQLRQRWPEYGKPMPAARLATRVDTDALQRVRPVEPDLATLLDAVGL